MTTMSASADEEQFDFVAATAIAALLKYDADLTAKLYAAEEEARRRLADFRSTLNAAEALQQRIKELEGR